MLVDTKLEKLLAGQKRLEQRIMNLEKSVNNKNNTSVDLEYLKVINILVIVCIRRKLMQTYANLHIYYLTFNLLRRTLNKSLGCYLKIQYIQRRVNLEKRPILI